LRGGYVRKLLNSLYILDTNAYLTLDGENVVCKLENDEKFRLPFSNVENIFCFSYQGASPALMGKCAEYGIPINFLTPTGRFLAVCSGKPKGNAYLRKAQYQIFDKQEISLSQNTVASKLANTIYVINRTLRDYPEVNSDGEVSNCINQLKEGIDNVYEATEKESILGIEGNCARAYFRIFHKLILKQKEEFALSGRTKRPPLDKVNAVLSFLYTIHTLDYASALNSVGLDSYVGFYHTLRSGRDSLACDMVEESRCIVERLVLTLINRKQINENDFDKQVSGAVLLNDAGKKKVLTAWQERKKDAIMHPYIKEKIPYGLLPFVQASLMAKYIRGEISEYPCFLWKQVR
jgi:CRISPR-associated protein Cas1